MDSEIKIDRVVVVNDFSVARGGATSLVLDLILGLVDLGYKVTFITGDRGENKSIVDLGVEVIALSGNRLLDSSPIDRIKNGFFWKEAESTIRAWISANDTSNTVYHVHGWAQILSIAVFSALKPVSRRTVIHAHDAFLLCPNGGFIDYRKKSVCHLRPLSQACLLTNCDKRNMMNKVWRVARTFSLNRIIDDLENWGCVVLIADQMKLWFERSGVVQTRLTVIPNPSRPFTSERVKCEDNSTFFYIGRVTESKGVAEFLSACSIAGVQCEVIGDGDQRAELEKKYMRIKFHGWKSHEEIGEILKSARAVVVPSIMPEPFGLVIVEALKSGVPVVLSNNALLAALVKKRGGGVSFNSGDIEGLCGILEALRDMSNLKVKKQSVQAMRTGNELSPSHQNSVRDVVKVYQGVIGSSHDSGERVFLYAVQ